MRNTIALMFVVTALVAGSTTAFAQAQNPQPPPIDPGFNTEIVVTPERGETPRSLVPASTIAAVDLSCAADARFVTCSSIALTSFLYGDQNASRTLIGADTTFVTVASQSAPARS